MSDSENFFLKIVPEKGYHVLHLFFKINLKAWSELLLSEKEEIKLKFHELISSIKNTPCTQLRLFTVIGHKADWGMMLLTPNLQDLDSYAKQLIHCFGEIFHVNFSWFSITEESEYMTTSEEYRNSLREETSQGKKFVHDINKELRDFEIRMEKYRKDRLEPILVSEEEWPIFCFYPMSKKRETNANWYLEPYHIRKQMMKVHGEIGRQYRDRVRQLITSSTGLDNMEWAVSLFAKNTTDIKEIVYKMRFDEVSARYAQFGDFFIGIVLSVDQIFQRLMLD